MDTLLVRTQIVLTPWMGNLKEVRYMKLKKDYVITNLRIHDIDLK